ncbi:peptidase inhibitor family I36 protein [Micromonospora sp. CPCC 205561]|uniref:peptidase inhibitor family I36 protein n=1 Tax=Micromonospora sp. CPCC 205561 TaxID=3122407 RepID=UPI002FF0E7FA
MKLRLFLTAAFAAAAATLAAPAAAHAGPDDNLNASVSGIASQAAGTCPYTAFCLYTDTYLRGRMFVMYACGDYALFNWNGHGSVVNNQTPGTWADLLDQNRNPIHGFAYRSEALYVDFDPYWYAQPC